MNDLKERNELREKMEAEYARYMELLGGAEDPERRAEYRRLANRAWSVLAAQMDVTEYIARMWRPLSTENPQPSTGKVQRKTKRQNQWSARRALRLDVFRYLLAREKREVIDVVIAELRRDEREMKEEGRPPAEIRLVIGVRTALVLGSYILDVLTRVVAKLRGAWNTGSATNGDESSKNEPAQ